MAQHSPIPKLGKRLKAILHQVNVAQQQQSYDYIWDGCCDHGYLGIHIQALHQPQLMLYVDRLSHLTEDLSKRLKYGFKDGFTVITANICDLNFDNHKSHLMVLAGVGGEQIINFLESRSLQDFDNIDFIFSPSTGQYELRSYLHSHQFGLKYETLVTENKRSYEIIYTTRREVSEQSQPQISRLGQMWQTDNQDHIQYLTKLAQHYQNRSRNDLGDHSALIASQYTAMMSKESVN